MRWQRPGWGLLCLLVVARVGICADAPTTFPAMEQLQAQAALGDFVSVYSVKEFRVEPPAGAKPRLAYRNVFVTHGGATRSFLFRPDAPLPTKAELIAGMFQVRQLCSRKDTWEAYDPKSGVLTVRHKPDPWTPGTFWNPYSSPLPTMFLPFEPLGWLRGDMAGVSLIEHRDWFNRKWIDERFRKLLRGEVVTAGETTTFALALIAVVADENTGAGIPKDQGRKLTVTVARKKELRNIPVIERMMFGADPADPSVKDGVHRDFQYVLKERPAGAAPLLKSAQTILANGAVYETWDLEYWEGIDKSEAIDLAIDPGLAKKVWDETYRLEIEAR